MFALHEERFTNKMYIFSYINICVCSYCLLATTVELALSMTGPQLNKLSNLNFMASIQNKKTVVLYLDHETLS